jgi:hypothetical protein
MIVKMKFVASIFGALVVVLAGCQSAPQNQPAQTAQAPAQPATTAGGATPSSPAATGAGGVAATPQPALPTTITIPAGTKLSVRLINGISSGSTPEGSSFEATLASPLVVNGTEAAAVGSSVTGSVVRVVSSGRLNRPAELALTLTSLTPRGGRGVNIATSTWSMKGESHKKRDIEMIGGGAVAGTIIGALAGGKKGAGIGALIGGGGGTAVAAGTGKKEISLASETKINFTLQQSITLPIRR